MIEEVRERELRRLNMLLAHVTLHLAVDHDCFTWMENGNAEFVSRDEFLRRSKERRRSKTPQAGSSPFKEAA